MPGSWVRILAEMDRDDSFLLGTIKTSDTPGGNVLLVARLQVI